jgi:hypothetical protein
VRKLGLDSTLEVDNITATIRGDLSFISLVAECESNEMKRHFQKFKNN